MKLSGNSIGDIIHHQVCGAKDFHCSMGYEISAKQKKEISEELTRLFLEEGMDGKAKGGICSKLYRLHNKHTGKTCIVTAKLSPNCYPLIQVQKFEDEATAKEQTDQVFSSLPNLVCKTFRS